MKLFDFGAGAALVALLFGTLVAQGGQVDTSVNATCERVQMPDGYFNYVDPTCAAQFWEAGSPDPERDEEEESQ